MNTLSQEYVNILRKYIGEKIIRVAPAEDGMYYFTEKIVRLDSINTREIRISWDNDSSKKIWLDSSMLDENWMPLVSVLENSYEPYKNLEGKYVKRKYIEREDSSYTRKLPSDEHYKMIKATKTHLFLERILPSFKKVDLIIHHDREVYHGWILDPEFN